MEEEESKNASAQPYGYNTTYLDKEEYDWIEAFGNVSLVAVQEKKTAAAGVGKAVDPLPLYIVSGVMGALFIILPILVRGGPNQGVIRCSMMLTIFSLWIFWATVYIAQMRPIVSPRLANTSLAWMKKNWLIVTRKAAVKTHVLLKAAAYQLHSQMARPRGMQLSVRMRDMVHDVS